MTAASPPVQVLIPEVARLALTDGQGRPMRTAWARARDQAPPIELELHTSPVQGQVSGFPVGVTAVRDPRLLALMEEGVGHAGVALDAWVPETDQRRLGQGYRFQHWLVPWMVVWRGTGSGYAYNCLAIEHPARASYHDLWWPRDAPAPLRAWQFILDASAPPVPD